LDGLTDAEMDVVLPRATLMDDGEIDTPPTATGHKSMHPFVHCESPATAIRAPRMRLNPVLDIVVSTSRVGRQPVT
jgi:hypothetical protein